jgi:hypothetical protein
MNLVGKLLGKIPRKLKVGAVAFTGLVGSMLYANSQNINNLESYRTKEIPENVDTNYIKKFAGWAFAGINVKSMDLDGLSEEEFFTNLPVETEPVPLEEINKDEEMEKNEKIYRDTFRVSNISLAKEFRDEGIFYLPEEIEFSAYDSNGRVVGKYLCSRKKIDSADFKKRMDPNSFRGFDSVTLKEFFYDESGNVQEEKTSFANLDSNRLMFDPSSEDYLDKIQYILKNRTLKFHDERGNVKEEIVGEDLNQDGFLDQVKKVLRQYNLENKVVEEMNFYDPTPEDGKFDNAVLNIYE